MEKRLLVAIFLSFLVLYAYQVFVLKPAADKAKREAPVTATTPANAPAGQPASPAGAAQPAAPSMAPAAAAAAETATPLVADQADRDVVVQTRTVRAVFSNRGARLKSWTLKSYLDLSKQPQELVPVYLRDGDARPFDLMVDDEAATARLRDALFLPSAGADGAVDATGQSRTVTFDYKDAAGLVAHKSFTFEPTGYAVHVTVQVEAGGRALNPTVLWGPGLGDQIPGATGSSYVQKPQAIIMRGDKVQRVTGADIIKQPVQEGDFSAVGVDDQYFIAMALPQRMVRADYTHVLLTTPAGAGARGPAGFSGALNQVLSWIGLAQPIAPPKEFTTDMVAFGVRQAQSMTDLTFFFGPKDFDVLEAASAKLRLVRTINFGIFDFLAVPLLRALKWIHGYVGNYGWSIIILTFLINAVMFPLRHKSMVSMRKMQEIQPQVKAIQDRYAGLKTTDPARQKMNSEMMSLYKEKGVNPASGCIPMLLTMPVLFAFYSLLSQAIEIRGEPFIWWIRDLSSHDPYYVTPILMGASQLWQQKMTPAAGDPVQQKMMMMMPLVFTFMFLWMPSGLTVYWFFSNLMAIGQQYLTNHLVGPPNTPRPPAERKLKTTAA